MGIKRQNPCSGPLTVYQDLSACHDWPVTKANVDLPIRLKGNSKCIFSNLLSLLRAQKKDISAASQTLLTWVKIYITLLTVTYKLTCIAGSFVGEGVSTQMNGEAGRKFLIVFYPFSSQVLICACAPNKTARYVFNQLCAFPTITSQSH